VRLFCSAVACHKFSKASALEYLQHQATPGLTFQNVCQSEPWYISYVKSLKRESTFSENVCQSESQAVKFASEANAALFPREHVHEQRCFRTLPYWRELLLVQKPL